MGKTASIFVAGIVTIGVITALTLPGRQSVALAKTGFTGAQGLLGTAIKG